MVSCRETRLEKHYCRFSVVFACLFMAGPASLCLIAGENKPTPIPQRIVAIAPSTAEMICDLGACGSIVGVSKFCVHPRELQTRTQVGGLYDPDIEGIIALHPDLLVTRGRHDALERLAERLKIPMYHDETDSLDGIDRTVQELGVILDRRDQAEKVVRDFRARLSRIRERTAVRKQVRVVLTVSRNPERLSNILTTGRGTFLGEMLEIAGGRNVFGELDMRYPEVSVEAIIAQQPDCIIELMPEVDVTSQDKQLREQWSQLSMIPAVRNQRVYFLSDDNALIPSPRYADFIEKISQILHPMGGTE